LDLNSAPEGPKSRKFPVNSLLNRELRAERGSRQTASTAIFVFASVRHQKWVELHPAISQLLPRVVAAEEGQVIRPRWDDVVSHTLIAHEHISLAELTSDLPYRFKPNLARIERLLPARDIRVSDLSLRYVAGAVTVSECPLEQMPRVSLTSPNLIPIDIWNEDVVLQFPLAQR
jgi:hypothetical protein